LTQRNVLIKIFSCEEILATFREEIAEDLAIIQGTDEQQAILDQIDSELDKTYMTSTDSLAGKGEEDNEFINKDNIVSSSLRQNEPAIAKSLIAEKQMRTFGNEATYIFDKNGNKVFENLWGTTHEVNLEGGKISGNTVTHFHLSGGTFSEKDITRLVTFNGAEFRATTESGITYSMRRGDNAHGSIVGAYNKAMKSIRKDADSYALKNSSTAETFNILKNTKIKQDANSWLVDNASKYGYIYTIESTEV